MIDFINSLNNTDNVLNTMGTRNNLNKYIGKEWNQETKDQMEDEFKPYKVHLCDRCYFFYEHFMTNTIRCVLEDNKISLLQFN